MGFRVSGECSGPGGLEFLIGIGAMQVVKTLPSEMPQTPESLDIRVGILLLCLFMTGFARFSA